MWRTPSWMVFKLPGQMRKQYDKQQEKKSHLIISTVFTKTRLFNKENKALHLWFLNFVIRSCYGRVGPGINPGRKGLRKQEKWAKQDDLKLCGRYLSDWVKIILWAEESLLWMFTSLPVCHLYLGREEDTYKRTVEMKILCGAMKGHEGVLAHV